MHIVRMAEAKISDNPSDILITHALGSCLGITIYDFKRNVGGMIHCMLPDASIDQTKAKNNPAMFVNSGMSKMLSTFLEGGSQKRDLIIKAAGGSSTKINEEEDYFQIGRRNFISLRKFLWDNGLLLKTFDIGGYNSRTVTLNIESGELIVKINGITKKL